MGRPHMADAFGQIAPDRKLSAHVSDELLNLVQRLAHIEGLTESAWLRRLAEREVIANIVNLPEITLRNGMYVRVHKVTRK